MPQHAWANLSALITTSLDKVRDGDFASIAQALKPAMPEIITALKTIAVDPATPPTQRLSAIARATRRQFSYAAITG